MCRVCSGYNEKVERVAIDELNRLREKGVAAYFCGGCGYSLVWGGSCSIITCPDKCVTKTKSCAYCVLSRCEKGEPGIGNTGETHIPSRCTEELQRRQEKKLPLPPLQYCRC